MTEGKSDRPSVACLLIRETDKAWLLDTGGDADIWFPKSQGELYKLADGSYELFGEAWIMKEKGLC